MAFFAWGKEYETGIKEVDAQHKKLIELINELYEAMRCGKGMEVMGKILSDLIKYTKTHFTYEEYLMGTYGFPELSSHKSEHQGFTSKVLDFERDFKEGKVGLTVQVMNFLKEWLANHILKIDKKYVPFLKSKGVA